MGKTLPDRIVAWPDKMLMWPIEQAARGLPEGCGVYVNEEVSQSIRSKVIEDAIEAVRKAHEDGELYMGGSPWDSGRNQMHKQAIEALTALKDKADDAT